MNARAREDVFIENLVATLARSPQQINDLQESDAELLRIPGSNAVLAMTTDSIVEELETGLYEDPYLIGWMTVIANVSDLAAVGADPLGILMNQTFAPDSDEAFIRRLQNGVGDACRAAGLNVLGGDTSFSSHAQFGGLAIGLIADGKTITRHGCRPQDQLFSTGPLGAGSAFAIHRLRMGAAGSYRPVPRLEEGRLIRCLGSCAMDTSDGLLPALDQLGRVNDVGFELDMSAGGLLHHSADQLARAEGIPRWMMLAGPHGEFELVFAVSPEQVEQFHSEAAVMGWQPIRLGRVVDDPGVHLLEGATTRVLDTVAVRNLAAVTAPDVSEYLKGLMRIDASSNRWLRERKAAS